MSPRDGFIGAWRVTESVYGPDGQLAGVVSQRRVLEHGEGGRVRVTQVCEPDAALADHPMGRFRGRWVFDLERDGDRRRYLGPDVLGSALAFGPGAMVGRGVWPRFGHNFTSFSLLDGPRQLTGGCFYSASQLVARIAGVAVPETDAPARPLHLEGWAPEALAALWRGTLETHVPGQVPALEPLTRRYSQPGEALVFDEAVGLEGHAGWHLEVRPGPHNGRLSGATSNALLGGRAAGIGLQSGPLFEAELVLGAEGRVSALEIFDGETQKISGLRRYFRDDTLLFTEVLRLSPEHPRQ